MVTHAIISALQQRRCESESTLAKKERTIETLEREVDILNRKVAVYSNETAKRQNLANSSEDPLSMLASLTEEKISWTKRMSDKDNELAVCKEKIAQRDLRESIPTPQQFANAGARTTNKRRRIGRGTLAKV